MSSGDSDAVAPSSYALVVLGGVSYLL